MMDNSYGCFSTLVAMVVVLAVLWVAVTAAVVLAIIAGVIALLAVISYAMGNGRERKAENSNPNPVRDRSG